MSDQFPCGCAAPSDCVSNGGGILPYGVHCKMQELPTTSLKHLLAAISLSRLAAAKEMRDKCERVAYANNNSGEGGIIARAIAELPLDE